MRASGMRLSTRMPLASTPSWPLSCARPTSRTDLLVAQLEFLHDLRDAFHLALQERTELARLAAHWRGAQLEETPLHFGGIQGANDRAVYRRDDLLRRIGGHQEAVPEIELVAWISRLGDRWNFGKERHPLFRSDGERAQAVRPHVAQRDAERREIHRRFAADYREERLAATIE